MAIRNIEGSRRSILGTTVPFVIVLGITCYGASAWISRAALDGERGEKLATLLRGDDDPVTTGALGHRADTVRLDPCLAPKKP
jgi:hypothetical protein